MSAATASAEAWNVAIFCADASTGENTHRLLEDTLAALGLRVQCHVRQWRFHTLGEFSLSVGERHASARNASAFSTQRMMQPYVRNGDLEQAGAKTAPGDKTKTTRSGKMDWGDPVKEDNAENGSKGRKLWQLN